MKTKGSDAPHLTCVGCCWSESYVTDECVGCEKYDETYGRLVFTHWEPREEKKDEDPAGK